MKSDAAYLRIGRWMVLVLLMCTCGGASFSSCDSEATTVVLGGFQSLATSFVNAIFVTIENQLEEDTTTDDTTTDDTTTTS